MPPETAKIREMLKRRTNLYVSSKKISLSTNWMLATQYFRQIVTLICTSLYTSLQSYSRKRGHDAEDLPAGREGTDDNHGDDKGIFEI